MKSGARWPLAIAGVLGLTVLANAFLFYRANDRSAAVVEPDYYRKAVQWDSTLAQARRDRELGWRIEASLGPLEAGGSDLIARLTSLDGTPIAGAVIRVTAIHNLDAAHPVTAALEPAGGDAYRARLPLSHAGLWELRFEAVRGGDRFTGSLRRDVGRGGSRP